MRKGTTMGARDNFGLPHNLCVWNGDQDDSEERQDIEYGSGNWGTRRRCQLYIYITFFLHLLNSIFDQTLCMGESLQPQLQPSSTTRRFLDASNGPHHYLALNGNDSGSELSKSHVVSKVISSYDYRSQSNQLHAFQLSLDIVENVCAGQGEFTCRSDVKSRTSRQDLHHHA